MTLLTLVSSAVRQQQKQENQSDAALTVEIFLGWFGLDLKDKTFI